MTQGSAHDTRSAATLFGSRAPSTAWERVPLADSPGRHVWVWYKPQGLGEGLLVTVPDDAWAPDPQRGPLTMRALLRAIGLDAAAVPLWSVYGVPCETQGGTNPLLDQPIPPPPPGADPRIAVYVAPVQWPGPAASPAVSVAAAGPGLPIFMRIENDWNAILQIEANLALLRKQLAAMLARINTLNRDLSPDERQYGDRKDKSDWQIARRWLRDVATKLSRCIKDHDMGHTSSAGKRNQFEQVYQQWITPRVAFDGLERVQRDFEQHRKTVATLLNNMQVAYSSAAQDGERRAQEILNRLAAKVRTARTRR
ncbi:MAG TPA: hypothetical protein VML55_03880 [Planctomycetaceae bacterium]|nr:hypothetical protein [Planctomycetaceae bacterium]